MCESPEHFNVFVPEEARSLLDEIADINARICVATLICNLSNSPPDEARTFADNPVDHESVDSVLSYEGEPVDPGAGGAVLPLIRMEQARHEVADLECTLADKQLKLERILGPIRNSYQLEISRDRSELKNVECQIVVNQALVDQTRASCEKYMQERLALENEKEGLVSDIERLCDLSQVLRGKWEYEKALNADRTRTVSETTDRICKAQQEEKRLEKQVTSMSENMCLLNSRLNDQKRALDSLKAERGSLDIYLGNMRKVLEVDLHHRRNLLASKISASAEQLKRTEAVVQVQRQELHAVRADLRKAAGADLLHAQENVDAKSNQLDSVISSLEEEQRLMTRASDKFGQLEQLLGQLDKDAVCEDPRSSDALYRSREDLEHNLGQVEKLEWELNQELARSKWDLQLLRERSISSQHTSTKQVCDQLVYEELVGRRLSMEIELVEAEVVAAICVLRHGLSAERSALADQIRTANESVAELNRKYAIISFQVGVLGETLRAKKNEKESVSRTVVELIRANENLMREKSSLVGALVLLQNQVQSGVSTSDKLAQLNAAAESEISSLTLLWNAAERTKYARTAQLVDLTARTKQLLESIAVIEADNDALERVLNQTDASVALSELHDADRDLRVAQKRYDSFPPDFGRQLQEKQRELETLAAKRTQTEQELVAHATSEKYLGEVVEQGSVDAKITCTCTRLAQVLDKLAEKKVALQHVSSLVDSARNTPRTEKDLLAKINLFKNICAKTCRNLTAKIAELATYRVD